MASQDLWETKTEDFRDSSFMIAISVLQDAQKRILERTGSRRRIRCFFSESNAEAFAQLKEAVAPFHKPEEGFEIETYGGKFEDAVNDIQTFIGTSFPLIFIDPTGWTGYPFDKIKPLFLRSKCEVLINFMYEFINRFAYSDDRDTVASLDSILGGPGWGKRLDPDLRRGLAVEKLFRETLKSTGNFDFVISTRIDKVTTERPHFFLAYGTKSPDGLKTFRQTEYDALREHEKNRATAKEKKREQRSNMVDLFAGHQAELQEATIDEIVDDQKTLASADLMATLAANGPLHFSSAVARLLQAYMLRETKSKIFAWTSPRPAKSKTLGAAAIGSPTMRVWSSRKPNYTARPPFVGVTPSLALTDHEGSPPDKRRRKRRFAFVYSIT
jgi:three-Cys-motif partner protein